MRNRLLHIQPPKVNKCHYKSVRMRILSALRALLYGAICRVDEALASDLQNECLPSLPLHRGNTGRVMMTNIQRASYADNTGIENTLQTSQDPDEIDYAKIALTEV